MTGHSCCPPQNSAVFICITAQIARGQFKNTLEQRFFIDLSVVCLSEYLFVWSVLKTSLCVVTAVSRRTKKTAQIFVKSVSNPEIHPSWTLFSNVLHIGKLQKNIAKRPAVSLVIYNVVILINIFCNSVRNLYFSK